MADDATEEQQPEIVPRQPSHPITTTLLICSSVAVLICIIFTWSELFGYYLIGPKAAQLSGEKGMDKHLWKNTQKMPAPIDHYDLDFPGEKDAKTGRQIMEYNVKKDLGLTQEQEEKTLGGK